MEIDIAEIRTRDGKLYLFVANERPSKFPIAGLAHTPDRQSPMELLDAVIEAVPHRIHTVPTDNGIQFHNPPGYRTRRD